MQTKYAEKYIKEAQVYLYEKGVNEFIQENPDSLIFPRAMIVSALDRTLIITGYILVSIENLAQVALNLLGVMFNLSSYVCGCNGYQFDCSYGDALYSLETALFIAACVPISIGLLHLKLLYTFWKIMYDPKKAYQDIIPK